VISQISGGSREIITWCTYECHVVGMLSHQLLQHVIDGKKAIIQNPTEGQRLVLLTGGKCSQIYFC